MNTTATMKTPTRSVGNGPGERRGGGLPTTQQGTLTEADVVLSVDTHLDVHVVVVALDRCDALMP